MIEKQGNVLTFETLGKVLRCITTNSVVKANGELVMGAGLALAAKQKFPELPKLLGQKVTEGGNHVYIFETIGIASFPTKHHFRDNSDKVLIEQSCQEISKISASWDIILLPRPGCSLGKLDWKDVKPVLEKYFKEDKYIVLA